MKKMEKKKKKYSQWEFLVAFTVVTGLFAGVRHVFGIEVPMHVETSVPAGLMAQSEESTRLQEEENGMAAEDGDAAKVLLAMEESDDTEPDMDWEETDPLLEESSQDTTEMADGNGEMTDSAAGEAGGHRVRGVWSYADCFPDIQDVQIVAAQKHGITPVRNRREAEVLVKQHKLVNISHSPFYSIDRLTHSIPYLVPRAQHLLNTICLNFIDSCQVKGLPLHMPIVTSVLRTTDDVSNLQRGNKNATTNSCHCYGTTVDIAYNKFMPITGAYESDAALLRWNETMKQVLSEVLHDLRRQGKCYVKYERKQGCFHLTCR